MSEQAGVYHEWQEDPCWLVEVRTMDGKTLHWHKDGRLHYLSKKLGDMWTTHFKPHLFSVLPDGSFIPHRSHPDGMDIQSVRLIPGEDCDCGQASDN